MDQLAIIVLRGNLSENEEVEDIILGNHPETDARWTNLNLFFLSLFILWNYLLSMLLAEGAILIMYKEFCSKA